MTSWDSIAAGRFTVTSDPTKVKSGTHALDGLITPTNGQGELDKWYMPGYDEVYVKYNVMFQSGFRNLRGDGNGMHFFIQMGNRTDNQWSASGQAGIKPNGTDFFFAGLDPEYIANDPTLYPLSYYTYFPDMTCNGGCWGDVFTQAAPKIPLVPGQWQEVVFHIKLNTPGLHDGSQELWVDGVKKISNPNMRWRDSTVLRLNQLAFANYMPGASTTEHIWVDDLVAWTPGSGTSFSPCDLNKDGTTNVMDVQLEVNMAIGVAPCTADINKDGVCNVVDVQRVVNAVLGGPCVSP